MTHLESLAEAYKHARETEKQFTFEVPKQVYDTLLKKYGLKNDGAPGIVDGGFISTSARRVSPFFSSNLNRTPMVRGTLIVAGLSEAGRDQLADKIIDHFHDNDNVDGGYSHRVAFNYELVSKYERSFERKR